VHERSKPDSHFLTPPVAAIFAAIPSILQPIVPIFTAIPHVFQPIQAPTMVSSVDAILEQIPSVFASVATILTPVADILETVAQKPSIRLGGVGCHWRQRHHDQDTNDNFGHSSHHQTLRRRSHR
jgi:hypothetical protein